MRIRILHLLLALVPFIANATVYYVSPTGSDTNNGTSQTTSWKTITRVNQISASLQPGDQVLFQSGGVYRGKLTISSNGSSTAKIVIGAYGTGAQPVISGSVAVTGWTAYSGNIWRAPVSQTVKNVFVNGALMTLARYPNTGWLRVDQGTATSLTDAALTQASGYWNGTTAVIRTTNWSYDTARVSAFTGHTLTHSTTGNNLGSMTWGYFLRNKLSELDAAGEWFYDRTAGQLYVWCPANANPNSQLVEASVLDNGIYVNWQKQHIKIIGIALKHQYGPSLYLSGSTNVEATTCTISDTYQAIRSTGSSQNLNHLTIQRTFATAVYLMDNSTSFTFNTLTDIGIVPGLGENDWGYLGVRTTGNSMVITDNVLQNIGYTGIFVQGNALVERNVVRNAVSMLNDGGGIHFDTADGMIIRNNIVSDISGNLESVAANYSSNIPIAQGIYFGNISIKNTQVKTNTVSNCRGSGIHMDHTMVSVGNRVEDNVLFNNDIQLTVSDYSNYNGPGATSPYYVASYNDVITGNTMYCLNRSQLCMKQFNCYSASTVDFGTFTNNKYFNPYTELSIFYHNLNSGVQRYFTLERLQYERNEDVGSTRSPLRLETYATTSELTGNLVLNGTFTSNVSGWAGWPTNAIVTRDLTYLDAGALKAYLPNASQDPEFKLRSPDQFSMQSGQWYRLKFSSQSNIHGIMRAGVKGASQMGVPTVIYERSVPFDTQRRDMVVYFQSNLTDQAVVQITNSYTEPQYWIDNLDLRRVTVQAIDPLQEHLLYANQLATPQNFTLPSGCWADVSGTTFSGTVTIQPYTSKVYYRVTGGCGISAANSVGAKVLLGGAMIWPTGLMRENLRQQNLIPATEPYTAMGLTVENTGASVSAAQLQVTGANAIIDWILLELRSSAAGYPVVARRAALVRSNGTVVAADGSSPVAFTATTVGRYLVVKHRNHLGAMASTPIATNGQTIDFTSTALPLYGTDAEQVSGSIRALWAGDVNADATVRYAGASNDSDALLVAVGNVPTTVIHAYSKADVNMDGYIKYTGAGNDRDFILATIGGVVTTAIRSAQLP